MDKGNNESRFGVDKHMEKKKRGSPYFHSTIHFFLIHQIYFNTNSVPGIKFTVLVKLTPGTIMSKQTNKQNGLMTSV